MPHSISKSSRRVGQLLLVVALTIAAVVARKPTKCQDDECSMRPEHFKLYSSIKRALEQDFSIKGKDLVPLIRSVEVLQRRFGASPADSAAKLNGTKLVLDLLQDAKLREAMGTFNSDEGRQLVNLYKTSINGNHQNLACSKWRVEEIQFASRQLESSERLSRVFRNIHKNFLERSARKCLKSSCSSIDDNMSRLDSVLRRSSRRKGFLARDDLLAGAQDAANELADEAAAEALIAQVNNEPVGEFQHEELELCRFFKRTNGSCQVSGNELGEIAFNDTARASLSEYLEAYESNAKSGGVSETESGGAPRGTKRAAQLILAQCRAIKPTLEYHLFGLRWFQRQGLITGDKLRARAVWCPSLTYWTEIERLCGELEAGLVDRDPNSERHNETFAY